METEIIKNESADMSDELRGPKASVVVIVAMFLSVGLAGLICLYISWKWLVIILITVSAIIWRINEYRKKEQAERRLANKILIDKGMQQLEETWYP